MVRGITLMVMMMAVSACQPDILVVSNTENKIKRQLPPNNAAAYLVAQHASIEGDIEGAAREYTRALTADPGNISLLQRSFRSLYLDGQIDNAAAIASTLEQQGNPVSMGSEPIAAITAKAGDWSGLEIVSQHLNADIASRQLAIVLEAWALVFQGQGDAGLTRMLDLNPQDPALPPPNMIYSQSALIMDYLNRRDDAVSAALIAVEQPGISVGALLDMISVLARNGAMDDAESLVSKRLGPSFAKKKIIRDLNSGTSTLMQAHDQNGLLVTAVVEVAMSDPANTVALLARLQFARYIDADHDLLRYHLGNRLRQGGHIEKGLTVFQQFPAESPWYQPTMFVTALHRSRVEDDFEAAATLFEQMLYSDPENPDIWRYYGDAARRAGKDKLALEYYNKALDHGGDRSRLEYKRGVAFDNLGQDDAAEAALRESIAINNSDAYVLNYLGYWLLEHDGDPEEALGMIRAAVAAQPRNGYFMDSLGWGYYRLGRYSRAILFLERAAMLRPADPVIIDHLGDAYQKVGRLQEAIYQWNHALETPHVDIDPDIIKSKISETEAQLNP